MNVSRIAVIFDNRLRRETTGLYVRRALGELVEVEHFLPDELNRVSASNFDLFVRVDDGLDDVIPPHLRPLAWWAIDTHLDYGRSLRQAEQADFVFAAQRDGAKKLQQDGITTANWLPLACDPFLHARQEVPLRYDIAFVGNLFPGPRSELVDRIRQQFPNTFVGRRYFREMAETYSASRIVFNRSIADDLNMRVFEGLCSGSLSVTNQLDAYGQADLFQDGRHLVTYNDADELLEKLRWYLDHEEVWRRIAAAGRAEALARHTYRHRMETLLRSVSEQSSTQYAVIPTQSDPESVSSKSATSTMPLPDKTGGYFEHARPEVMALVPTTARRVLDVGCGAGRLGEALKQRQVVEVTGIELNPDAAARAESRLDRVMTTNIETEAMARPESPYHAIVCADILEHLRRPDHVLRTLRNWLSPVGRLVLSLPNVRHHSVLRSLLAGNFTYEPAGLLDDDHVRFFTRREIEKLLFRTGFEITDLQVVPGPGHAEWVKEGRPGRVQVGRLAIDGLDPREAEEFFAYQYLVAARPIEIPSYGLTTIILVTRNQWSYTNACLESIRQFTDEPYELIVVDNDSTDGTTEMLRSYDDVQLIENDSNRGFPAAANQGISVAQGEQVLLLNNDTMVTTGWLRRMLDVLRWDESIGLVGPCSNQVSGLQQIDATYEELEQLDGFAWDWGQRHRGQTMGVDRLVGFCLLLRRELIDDIGLLDEQFGIGNFEDDDYCRRTMRAGYHCVIARDAFVHHYGSVSFRGEGVDFSGLLQENQRRFDQKWSVPPPDKRIIEATASTDREFGLTKHLDGGLLLVPRTAQASDNQRVTDPGRPRLSLCMIVRDNADIIEECLTSIRPYVDEMIVVDTGSRDATPKLTERLGARLFYFPWCDDFSTARNESLRHARGEWLFWMDSDDTIPPECGRKLRALADEHHDPSVLGYVMQVHCPAASAGDWGSNGASSQESPSDYTTVDHVKLFRNHPDLRFEGRIHEQVLPAIRRANGEVRFTDIYVVHSGTDHSPETRQGKYDRDFHLLELELQDHPDHPFALFNLGMTHLDAGQYEPAIEALQRSLAVSSPEESHVRKAYALLIGALVGANHQIEARETCRAGLDLFPDDAELLFRSGTLAHHFGDHREAIACYESVLNRPRDRYFQSVDRGITSYKSRHNLALVHEEIGNAQEAERLWREVVEEVPHFRPAWRGLGELLLKQGREDQLVPLTEWLTAEPCTSGLGRVFHARLLERRNDFEAARAQLEAALTQTPDNLDPLRELCRLLFERYSPAAAEDALTQLVELEPDDASVHHNLGIVCLHTQRPVQAVDRFQESLRLRPDSAATWVHLGESLAGSDQSDAAADAFRQALHLSPGLDAASAALRELCPDDPILPTESV